MAVFALVSVCAGCSLINPNVSPPSAPSDESTPQTYVTANRTRQAAIEKVTPGEGYYGDLPGAIDYANAMRSAYYDAVGDQEKLRSGLALTLIPIAATALYLGLTHGSTDAVAGLATGGAAAYGLGTFFLNEPRERVYLQGSLTLGCAIIRSGPYLVKTREYNAMIASIDELATALAKLRSAISQVEAQSPHDAASIAAVGDGKAVASDGEQALTEARALIGRIDAAGPVLLVVVDNIRDQVSLQITKTEPDLAAIRSIATNLGSSEKLFAGMAPATPAATGGKATTTVAAAVGERSSAWASRT
jgi:hypothetical protein